MDNNGQVLKLQLSSSAFKDGQPIPAIYTCKGENISPPLSISNISDSTKSLALIMHDPDAIPVAGIDFVHWLIWNIPVTSTEIAENSSPIGAIIGTNSRGNNIYTGPCPPPGTGTHHYIFELYAIDRLLDLPIDASREQLEATMNGHISGHHSLTSIFPSQ